MDQRHILITGRPRVGKTTLICHCARLLGNRAGGFFTEEMKGEGVRGRKGFKLTTLDGQEGILARADDPQPYRVGRYGVHLETLDRLGVPAVLQSIQNKEWILIDEIGKMEEGSFSFKQAVLQALDSPKRVLATIRWNDSPFTMEIKNRSDVGIFKLTVPGRERIYREIETALKP